jgi:GNAT superfamily N-acetyltransferase
MEFKMIRKAKGSDLDSIAILYIKFLEEVWPNREIHTSAIHSTIEAWLSSKVDILVADVDKEIVGFFLGYVDTNNGTMSPMYRAEALYVLPEYRLTRLSYEMFRLPITIARPYGLPIISNASVITNSSNLYEKLGAKLIFKEMVLNEY